MRTGNRSQDECSRILEFLDSILTFSDNFRRQVLISLKQIFGYQRATFFLIDSQGNMFAPILLNIDAKLCDVYAKYYFKRDIFRPQKVAKKALQKNVLTVTDIMPVHEFVNTEYYNDFLRMQDIYHEIAMFLMEDNRPIGVIGLYRSAGEKGFTAAELKTLQSISFHISRLLAGNMLVADSQSHKGIFEHTSQNLPLGLIIFDRQLNVHYINDAAAQVCRDFFGVANLNVCARRFIGQLTGDDFRGQPSLKKTFFTPSLKEITVSILPAVYHYIKEMEFYTACIVPAGFSLQDYLEDSSRSENVFSRRESEILELLLKGLSNNEIARRLFISEHTVKTHLQNIYKKMGVKNRTSLCYKVNAARRDALPSG